MGLRRGIISFKWDIQLSRTLKLTTKPFSVQTHVFNTNGWTPFHACIDISERAREMIMILWLSAHKQMPISFDLIEYLTFCGQMYFYIYKSMCVFFVATKCAYTGKKMLLISLCDTRDLLWQSLLMVSAFCLSCPSVHLYILNLVYWLCC